MYVVTNRIVDESKTGEAEAFGKTPAEGPNNLRLVEVTRKGQKRHIHVLPDEITPDMADSVGLPSDGNYFASEYVARKLLERCAGRPSGARSSTKGRNLLLFVHGFNNDMTAVLDRAERLETQYGVEVVCFSWPANGGGLHGVLSYRNDKRDAAASIGALDRVLEKMELILHAFHDLFVADLEARAEKKFADDAEAWDRYFAQAVRKRCPFTINLMLHSMGNYLFKRLLTSSIYSADHLLFDNVVMVAADTNNEGHAEWVDNIQSRGRVYITINERDSALKASRMKMGELQKARLGHYGRKLDSRVATYVDFTGQPHVGDSHAYFEGGALANKKVDAFFKAVLNGEIWDKPSRFDPARNIFRL